MHKAAGRGGDVGGCPVVGRPRSCDAARDAPGPGYHKPKIPIGRRGASLICLRTNRVGARASPAPLRLPINPRPEGRRALRHVYAPVSTSSAAISSVSLW